MAKVGIVMGSDSDLKVMSKAADMLEELGIEYELTIISAHREPDELIEWTRGAEDRDVKVIIAGAEWRQPFRECVQRFCTSCYRSTAFRKESGWNGCSVLNHADATWSACCHSCN